MKKITNKLKKISNLTIFCFSFLMVIIIISASVKIAEAAWQEPTNIPPDGNIYLPLNIGPERQAKEGNLLLNPLHNSYGETPEINFPLEIRGPKDVFINDFVILPDGDLVVDTDTLYVDGVNSQVVIGAISADTDSKLEVQGRPTSIGSDTAEVTGVGIKVLSTNTSELYYGISNGLNQASILGVGLGDSAGVYGQNLANGPGIYAETNDSSALVGKTSSQYSNVGNVVAGLYAKSTGLGAWAGYFEQRLYGSTQIVGKNFIPNKLQYSEVPYTAGWEVEDIESSNMPEITHAVFDGNYIWAAQLWDWDIEPYFYIIDPIDGSVKNEFRGEDSGGQVGHSPQDIKYAGGYVWLPNNWDDLYGLTKINPSTYETTIHKIGDHAGDDHDGPVDLVYDDDTPGGPYIWTVNEIDAGGDDWSVTRFKIADNSYVVYDTFTDFQCASFDYRLCEDTIDNDGKGDGIDASDPDCINPPTAADLPIVATEYESVEMRNVIKPTGITLQPNGSNPYIWLSFSTETGVFGEGIAKFSASDPVGSYTGYCLGTNIEPVDIDFGGGAVWIANNPLSVNPQVNYAGFSKIDPATGTELNKVYIPGSAERIRYDNNSTGAPWLWVSNQNDLIKFDLAGNEIYKYFQTAGNGGFDFDLASDSAGHGYVWSSSFYSASVTKNNINNPYDQTTYPVQGAGSSAMVFDGTNIWSADEFANTVSKYRASDGDKVGTYQAGWDPLNLAYDGENIWVRHHERGAADTVELTKLRGSDGDIIGQYDIGVHYYSTDMIFDGRYLWESSDQDNLIKKIDLDSCSGNTCGNVTFGAGDGLPSNPRYLAFDGDNIWVTHGQTCTIAADTRYNCFSKFNTADNSITTYYLAGAKEVDDNIDEILFDGVYLWFALNQVDYEGNSIYKVRPATGEIVGKYQIYHEPGICSDDDTVRPKKYCTSDSECTGGGTCSGGYSVVKGLGFDGVNIWAVQKSFTGAIRECFDNKDNDNDSLCDSGGCCDDETDKNNAECIAASAIWLPADPQCTNANEDITHNYRDLHEEDSSDFFGTTTDAECSDGVDNDGNGQCDYDGAVGKPGCSGQPDLGCSNQLDESEVYPDTTMNHLTRIVAATGEVVESIPYANYCSGSSDVIFDGTSIWWNNEHNEPGYCDGYALHKYYTGVGFNGTDFTGSVKLVSSFSDAAQSGAFSNAGEAIIGTKLIVLDDLVVNGNLWGGSEDSLKNFGDSCDDGQFAKGISSSSSLFDFPVMVHIDNTNTDFWNNIANQDEVRFGDGDGNPLNFHFEKFDYTNKDAIAWVRVSRLQGNTTDHIFAYYGNSGAVNGENENGTYDQNYIMVQHLEESCSTVGCRTDSTNNGNDGTAYSDWQENTLVDLNTTSGVINSADYFNANYDMVKIPDDPSFDIDNEITLSAWINQAAGDPDQDWITIMSKFVSTGAHATNCDVVVPIDPDLQVHKDIYWYLYDIDGLGGEFEMGITLAGSEPAYPCGRDWESNVTILRDTPTRLTITYDGSILKVYRNGEYADSITTGLGGQLALALAESTEPLYIGKNTKWGEHFNGLIDEVQISNIARSADWIKVAYLSESDNLISNWGAHDAVGSGSDWYSETSWPYRQQINFNYSTNGQSQIQCRSL